MTLIYISIAFIAGIFFHKVYSALGIIFGLKSHLLTVIENEILTLVVKMYSNIIMTLERSYTAMQAKGVDEEKIKLLRNEDEHNLREWKEEIIQSFIDAYPTAYRAYLHVENWETAMEQLAAYNAIMRAGAKKNEITDNNI